jgi:hypothetical protein
MARLGDRLSRLEDRARPAAPVLSETERHKRWLWRQRDRRRDATPKSAFHARERLAWLRMVGRVPGDAEALIEEVMAAPDASGYMQPPEERSRPVTEAVIFRAIYYREPGLEHLAEQVPEEWSAAFEAAETLAQRFLSMPPAVVAKWWLEARTLRERGASDAEIAAHAASYERPYGITEELLTTALGPDREILDDQERHWIVGESIADAMLGEWGWAIEKQIVEQEKKAKNTRRLKNE